MADEKSPSGKKYAVLPKETIRMFAEAAGHSEVPEEVANLLAEDAVYRLREVVQNSCQFMRHAKRKKLTTEDVNKSLRNSDIQPIHGYGNPEPLNFKQTKEGELCFTEDYEIDLANIACSSHVPKQAGKTTVKAQWLVVEGVQKSAMLGGSLTSKGNGKVPKTVSADLLQYYENVTKAILGNDEEIMKLALSDLRTNSKISPVLPYFVNFVSNGVKTVSHDTTQLTKLLHTVRALTNNSALYLQPKPYLEMLVQAVMYCVIEPLAASINPLNDHWALRDYAARLLAQITGEWDTAMIKLREKNVMALQEVLYDLTRPFSSHYGAVMGLLAFGTQAVEEILLPHLPSLWPHLQNMLDDSTSASALMKADANKVCGAIMLAAEYVLRARTQQLYALAEHQQKQQQQLEADDQHDEPPPPVDAAADLEPPRLSAQTSEEPPTLESEGHNAPGGPVKPEPSTSTPIKPSVQIVDQGGDDLIGPVLQLPETTNPYRIISEIYNDVYGYFGDGLAMKLPVKHIKDYYRLKKDDVYVSLADADSKKSGEELLQQFLEAAKDSEKSVENQSENQSYEPTPDEMDVDYDMDEKSERSERSSRSSRSDRSHSDESFMGEDTDLTMKATVSASSQGIKLTIFKRPKLKSNEFPAGSKDDVAAVKQEASNREREKQLLADSEKARKEKRAERFALEWASFEKEPLRDEGVMFVFHFLGKQQVCRTPGKQEQLQLRAAKQLQDAKLSDYVRLGNQMKPYGKRRPRRRPPATSLTKARWKMLSLHHYTATMDAIL